MPAPKKIKKKTSFVPRIVYATVMVGGAVIPLCVACGGKVEGERQILPGVALVMVDSGINFVVAATGFDSGVDTGIEFTVAATGFDSGPDTTLDIDGSFTVAAMGFEAGDAPFGVADTSFGGDSGKPGDAGEG